MGGWMGAWAGCGRIEDGAGWMAGTLDGGP